MTQTQIIRGDTDSMGGPSLRLADDDASCSLWLTGCPSHLGLKTACVGDFQCGNANAGRALLDAAAALLARRGYDYLLGPMNGDTWHGYRLVVAGDGSPAFPLEPANPAFYPDAFADFDVIARYTSARSTQFALRDVEHYGRRLAQDGIRVRSLDANRAGDELRAIHRVSLKAFSRNFLYSPISEAAFMALYRPFIERSLPHLIWLAENDTLQGYLFAVPFGRSLIIKSCASLYPGLGGYLVEGAHRHAPGLYERVVHALMHEDNVSRNNSDKYARTFRRYALYGRRL